MRHFATESGKSKGQFYTPAEVSRIMAKVVGIGNAIREKADFTVGKLKFKAELVPPALMIARYFSAEKAAIENLEAEVAAIGETDDTMCPE